MPLKEIHVQQFVRRFKERVTERGGRYAFFLGAGCSISSGIPGATQLVRRWLVELKKEDTGSAENLEEWLEEQFPSYNPENPAFLYADVMQTRFPQPRERQSEIERIVEGKDPGFGYGVFAKLITNDSFGPQCNVVLTSNFDDLVADALYLYTNKKPLVIAHESLAAFARETNRPLVIKVHGDALLDPKNLADETSDLHSAIAEALEKVMYGRGLVFLGYGGNDKGILKALKSLSGSALDWGIYWVNDVLPDNDFGHWLQDNDASWVKHLKFDELMLLIRNEFDFHHPDEKRFKVLMDTYSETFDKLSGAVDQRPAGKDKEIFESAIKKATSDFKDWWSVELEARRHKKKDPDLANKIYKDGLTSFPGSPDLLGVYAYFLHRFRKDPDKAEEYYTKAIELDPDNASNLGLYAAFLTEVRKDHAAAEEYFTKAIKLDPDKANILGNYAVFLKGVRKDHDKAEEYFAKAIALDPDSATKLGNYAGFLLVRGESQSGWEYLEKARALEDTNEWLELELLFYEYAHNPDEKKRRTSLSETKTMIAAGARSPYWDLTGNVERAVADKHPETELLSVLAKVIAEEEKASALNKFEAWKKA